MVGAVLTVSTYLHPTSACVHHPLTIRTPSSVVARALFADVGTATDRIPPAAMEAVWRAVLLPLLLLLGFVIAASSASDADIYLSTHNDARRAVGAGIPDLTWSSTLAKYAANWASNQAMKHNCDLAHSDGPYGENIFWASWNSTPRDAVQAWVDEKLYYHYKTNTCTNGEVCGHYTQVVWRNTKKLGCGSAKCPGGGTFVVCSYDPPGNYVGQKPY